MTLETDIAQLKMQEEWLQFDAFGEADAWTLGQAMRTLPSAVRTTWSRPDFRLDAMTDELRAIADKSIALDWKTFKMAHDAGVPIL